MTMQYVNCRLFKDLICFSKSFQVQTVVQSTGNIIFSVQLPAVCYAADLVYPPVSFFKCILKNPLKPPTYCPAF